MIQFWGWAGKCHCNQCGKWGGQSRAEKKQWRVPGANQCPSVRLNKRVGLLVVGYISTTLTHERMQASIHLHVDSIQCSLQRSNAQQLAVMGREHANHTHNHCRSIPHYSQTLTMPPNRISCDQNTFHGQTAIQYNSWISIKLKHMCSWILIVYMISTTAHINHSLPSTSRHPNCMLLSSLRIALYITMCLQTSLFKLSSAALECFLGRHCINQCVQHWTTKLLILLRQGWSCKNLPPHKSVDERAH